MKFASLSKVKKAKGDKMTIDIEQQLPHLLGILADKPEWLLQAVNTEEASRITGVPASTLISMRSKGGGPKFLKIENSRLVRYLRLHLYEWLLSGGIKSNTAQLHHEPTTDSDG